MTILLIATLVSSVISIVLNVWGIVFLAKRGVLFPDWKRLKKMLTR